MIGHVIDRYKIVDRLGAGGMGVVYRAVDTTLGRDVALKFLPGGQEEDSDAVPRFLREARAVSKLDHPNICTVYEIGETPEGGLFIAMACYDGETLKTRLQRGPLPVAEALEIARQIALGLREAHAEQIVHRDIKPANIFLTDEGRVKILDFGLAKVGGEPSLTRTGSSIGTPFYMAPEQILGEVDARSDLWALGILLYEMVAGEPAFQADNDLAVIHAILNKPVPPLAERKADLPPSLQPLVDGLLAKSPDDRFASADALLAALPPPPPEHPTRVGLDRWQKELRLSGSARHRLLSLVIGLLGLGLAAVAVYYALGSRQPGAPAAPEEQRTLVVLPFSYQGSPAFAYLGAGMVQLMSLRLDNTRGLTVLHHPAPLGPLAELVHSRAPEHTRQVAAAIGSDLLVGGDIIEVSGRISIEARCYRADGQELAAASSDGPTDDVFAQVDRVAADLIEQLGTERR
jgi:TolB-like protein